MNHKLLPVVGDGFTSRFFRLDFSEQDWSEKPHIRTSTHLSAQFAIRVADDGLTSLSIEQDDLLLFSATIPLRQAEQISLIRAEDEYIIGEACWTPDTTLIRAKKADAVPVKLPTENIRIVAALDHVIKRRNDLEFVYFKKIVV